MNRIIRSTDIGAALKARQKGFLLNPFRFGSTPPPTVYNSFQSSPVPGGATSATLSNSNRTWTTNTSVGSGAVNANYVTPIADVPATKLAYWEMTVQQLSAANTGYVYFNISGSYIWYVYGNISQIVGSTGTTNIAAGANGMILMFAVNCVTGKLWYGRDGTWLTTSGTPDPAAGTGQAHSFTAGTTAAIGLQGRTGDSAQIINCNFGHTAFTYTPPSGFSSINV